jgi:catechol 2,3-dioxygenase-like lactoylglutathione lyase family enzyme
MITGIQHATFLTSDLAKARIFYEEVLGLQPDTGRPNMGFDGMWYCITPNQQIHLMVLPNPETGLQRPAHGGRDRHVALTVSNITQLIDRLEVAKVAYTLSQSGRQALFCRDPDQNALEFVEVSSGKL